jgi:putative membrane protein
MKILLNILIVALTLFALPHLLSGIEISDFYTALLVSVLWGIVGITIKPLIHLFALPITILTLGLFAFVINALLFWLVAALVPGFTVHGFVPALLGSLIITVVSWVGHTLLK